HRSEDSVTAAVTELVAESQRSLGFRPVLRIDGPLDTVTGAEITDDLLATVREALSNIARHASATQARVTIEASASGIGLTVADDGRGVTRRTDATPGRGLRNLAARAERHGGGCTLDSSSAGTTLSWHVPL
ncbi:MAG: ATPase, partial [Acidimicrobiales bacterium]|nr:ATPase [Acidimicrobiales bacterium]